jgi:hypothetical protein
MNSNHEHSSSHLVDKYAGFGMCMCLYRGADKSLARLGRKQAAATEDFDFHKSYL